MPDKKGPAIIDDQLPGGPRWMHNLYAEPVWVETKTELQRHLDATNQVLDVRNKHAKYDKSPWATRTRLKPGAVDPFLPKDDPAPPASSDLPGSTNSEARTTGTVGEDHAPKPVIQMTVPQLRTIREYARYMADLKLTPDLYCRHCFAGELGNPIQVHIDPGLVLIVCDCTIRVGRAATHLSPRLHVYKPGTILLPGEDVPSVQMGQTAADLLRAYKRTLERLSLMEVLWCDRCERASRAHGVSAFVGSKSVRLTCRCQNRQHTDPK